MTLSPTTIHDFLSDKDVNLPALADFLDQLHPSARLHAVRSLKAAEQAVLFDATAGYRPARLNDFVPEGTPPLKEVIHHGRNSLPTLSFFEKRFCLSDRRMEELWGYNEHALKTLTGPGYFVARRANEFEVMIDYSKIPSAKPETWPKILPNSARLGRFLYYGLIDVLRGVSQHVTVGRAMKEGKALDNWFVLCRSDGQ